MTIYPEEQKTSLIDRMLPPAAIPVPQLSQEMGIPKDTLYGWRRQACRACGLPPMGSPPAKERWSSGEKFAMVVETVYCSSRKWTLGLSGIVHSYEGERYVQQDP